MTPNPATNIPTIGERIRALREAKDEGFGWSMRRVARLADIKWDTLDAIEKGVTAKPQRRILRAVAEALGTTYEDLVSGTTYEDLAA